MADKEIGFLGRLLHVVGQSSVFTYGLAIVYFYIQSQYRDNLQGEEVLTALTSDPTRVALTIFTTAHTLAHFYISYLGA